MSKSYKTHVFCLRALTNLHVGAGDSFYGAVDKMVQRDAATHLPTIHSHSLKGALREYFEEEINADRQFVNRIFGTPVKGDSKDARPGAYRFFSADLVALPVPEENPDSPVAYHLAADEFILGDIRQRLALMDPFWKTLGILGKQVKDAAKLEIKMDTTFSKRFKAAAEELPVVARNQLENGKSENLWYEELIPRESIFVVAIQSGLTSDPDDEKNFLDKINGKVIQIGANATVGYGYCLFTLLNPAS